MHENVLMMAVLFGALWLSALRIGTMIAEG